MIVVYAEYSLLYNYGPNDFCSLHVPRPKTLNLATKIIDLVPSFRICFR